MTDSQGRPNPSSPSSLGFLLRGLKGLDSLTELALDLRWSWNHATDKVWRWLDPDLWRTTRNPLVVLQTVSRDRIEKALADPEFRSIVDSLAQRNREVANTPSWFGGKHAQLDALNKKLEKMEKDSVPEKK